jgi:chromosomal replication initiation ATPase DnaA
MYKDKQADEPVVRLEVPESPPRELRAAEKNTRPAFDEEDFKTNNAFYQKLANSSEQQAALLDMYKTVVKGQYLRVLVHGGPGTGKTYFMGVVQDALESLSVRFQVMAPSGVAAAIHPTGNFCFLFLVSCLLCFIYVFTCCVV